jgi:hypothetical protein
MEKQKEYNLCYLLAKVRTTRGKALDRLRQRASKRNKKCRTSSDIGAEQEKSYCRTRFDVGSESVLNSSGSGTGSTQPREVN